MRDSSVQGRSNQRTTVEMMRTALCLLALVALATGATAPRKLRILAIFPGNERSHFVMSEQLARGLAARGHRVDVYGHFPLKNPPPNYVDHVLEGSKLHKIVNNVTYEQMETFAATIVPVSHMLELAGHPVCEQLGLPVFQDLIHRPPAYDLVIVEPFFYNCYAAWGRHLGLPMVGLMTTTVMDWMNEPLGNPFNPSVDSSVFTSNCHPMSFFERLQNLILYHYMSTMFNYHMSVQDEIVKKYFGPGFPSVVEMAKEFDLMLINQHHALHGRRAFVPAVVPVGGLHVVEGNETLDPKVQKFLDESKHGFIYFSFGSMFRIETFPKDIIDVFYSSFRKIAPVRVLIRIAYPEQLPKGLPSNVLTWPWLNQIKVLKHKNIKAFMTHGGLMGTQEAIYYGVPLIGVPLFGDQYLNIQTYVKKQIAIKIDFHNITEANLLPALTEMTKSPSLYKQRAEKLMELIRDVPMNPVDTAVFWVEYIARHGKGALRSPITELPWWQGNMLDVYALIAAVLLAVLLAFRLILKTVIRILMPRRPQRAATPKAKRH